MLSVFGRLSSGRLPLIGIGACRNVCCLDEAVIHVHIVMCYDITHCCYTLYNKHGGRDPGHGSEATGGQSLAVL